MLTSSVAERPLRLPRFVRATSAPAMQLTARDVEIVTHVAEHRLLSSQHLITLYPDRSPQKTLRRLRLLFDHGYLDRPPVQRVRRFFVSGSFPHVYSLGRKGAALLADRRLAPPERWAQKNRELTDRFFDHTLLISDIAVAFRAGATAHEGARVIPYREILDRSPEDTRTMQHAHRWRVAAKKEQYRALPESAEIGLIPDGIFGLEHGGKSTYFFLEADRGTMPIERGTGRGRLSLKGTSLLKKFIAYHETRRAALHTRRYGMKGFRVLTVTTGSPKRVAEMVKAVQQLPSPHGMFLFATLDAVRSDNPLLMPWMSGTGEPVHLLAQ